MFPADYRHTHACMQAFSAHENDRVDTLNCSHLCI
jgi:hypothetical protein